MQSFGEETSGKAVILKNANDMENGIEMKNRETDCEGEIWSELAQNCVQLQSLVLAVLNVLDLLVVSDWTT
jgi:hypothetical protein